MDVMAQSRRASMREDIGGEAVARLPAIGATPEVMGVTLAVAEIRVDPSLGPS